MTRLQESDVSRTVSRCPKCSTEANRGFLAGRILMLRCRACGFKWSEVVKGTFGGVIDWPRSPR